MLLVHASLYCSTYGVNPGRDGSIERCHPVCAGGGDDDAPVDGRLINKTIHEYDYEYDLAMATYEVTSRKPYG